MDTTSHVYNGKSWEASSTTSGKNSFFHAAFGVRTNENEPYMDKRVKYRRSRFATFLNYFENEVMPQRLVDIVKKCLSANEKYRNVSVEDQNHFEGYIFDIMKAEHDVTMEEVRILATLDNVKVILFKDGGSEPALIIKPDNEILGGYPNTEKLKGEVVLHMEGNIFSRMNPLVEDLLPKSSRDANKTADVKAAKGGKEQSGSGLMRYKKGGSAGSEGVQYQVGLSTLFLLNAMQKLKDWKLSTENTVAGKFDDVVLEWPDGSTLLQAKHKQSKTKKISLEDLLSTNSKSDDFSIPKYFLSYEEIKKTFNIKEVIICTNASVDFKVTKFLNSHKVNSESLLYYDKCDCKFYMFNDEILPQLTENVKSYYEKNYQNKGVHESAITCENIKDFVEHLQLFFNYPPGNDVRKVTEQLLTHMKLLHNSYVEVTPLDLYTKMLDWFQQKDGVYLTELYAKSIFSEIWREKHWQKLEKYNISFQCSDLDLQNSQRLFHFVVEGGCLLQEIKICYALQSNKTKFLFAGPDDDVEKRKRVIEAFGLPQYSILVLVWPKIAQEFEVTEASCKLREILDKSGYKKVVLIADCDNKIPHHIGLSYDIINNSIALEDLSRDSQERLLQRENIAFQGNHVSLKELLSTRKATEDYEKFLNTEELEKLVRDEKVKVGAPVLELDEHIREFYIKRKFKREIEEKEDETVKPAAREEIVPEELIYELSENAVVISDNAGTGKSTVLTNLAATVKKKYPALWIIRINLSDYTPILKEFLGKNREMINILDLLASKHSTKLTNRLEQAVFSMDKKVVLMLDGFDEISPDYTELVLSLLSLSQEQNFAKVIVTTRPYLAEKLKRKLQVEPFILEPFTEQNQIDFLVGYWMHDLGVDSSERGKCEEYAEALIEKMSYWVRLLEEGTDHFAAIPLHVRMLAEIFQENNQSEMSDDWKGCKEYLETSGVDLKLPENMNVTKLYEMFTEKKQRVFIDKGNPSGNTTANQALIEQFEVCLAYHKNLALELILGKARCELFSCLPQTPRNMEINVLKIGIVQKVDDKFDFAHRTFAEYFVAKSLIEELQLPNKNAKFQEFFIEGILLDSQYDIIQAFLNSFLQQMFDGLSPQCISHKITSFDGNKFYSLNNIVGNGHLSIFQLVLECVDLNFSTTAPESFAKFFKTPDGKSIPKYSDILNILQFEALRYDPVEGMFLEEAVKGGHLEMVKFLVEQGANVNKCQQYPPLHVALNSDCVEVAKFLVEQGANFRAKNDEDYGSTALYEAVANNNTAMAAYLLDRTLQCDGLNVKDPVIPYVAAYLGRLDILKELLKQGLDINSTIENEETVIFGAIRGGQLETTKYLVKQGSDIRSRDNHGNTALHVISPDPSLLSTAELLLELGIDVNATNDDLTTALHFAAEANNSDLVELLVNRGADVNLEDDNGNTALHAADLLGNIVKFLVEHGANINSVNGDGCTALHLAVEENCSPFTKFCKHESLNIIGYLLDRGVNPNIRNSNGCTVLHLAAEEGDLDIIAMLVEGGVDADITNINGQTALHCAAQGNHTDTVKFLMQNKADSNIINNYGRTALHLLAYSKYILGEDFCAKDDRSDVLRLIIQNAKDTNLRGKDGRTALHLASSCGDLDAVTLLVESGVDVDVTDKDSQTALHLAARKSYTDIVKFLMQNKADGNIEDKDCQTVLHHLVYSKHILGKDFDPKEDRSDVLRLVMQNTNDINLKGKDGRTALHLASSCGDLEAVILLVESGVNVKIMDDEGCSGLDIAVREGHFNVVDYLTTRCGLDSTVQDRSKWHLVAERNDLDTTDEECPITDILKYDSGDSDTFYSISDEESSMDIDISNFTIADQDIDCVISGSKRRFSFDAGCSQQKRQCSSGFRETADADSCNINE